MSEQSPPSKNWLQQFNKALSLHLKGQLTEARAEYLRLVVEQPKNLDLIKLLGLLEKDDGQLPMAVRWLELALSLHANLGAALQLADVRLRQGEFALAKKALDAAFAIEPGSIEASFQLGLVCSQAGESAAAIAAFTRVLAQQADHAQALSQLAVLQLRLGLIADSIESFQRYLVLRPTDVSALYNLGMAFNGGGRYADAVDSYRRAIAVDPGFTAAYNNLGSALSQLGDDEAALVAHDKSLELAPDDASYHYNRGLALFKLERFDEASAAYSRALSLRPSFVDAAFNRGNALREAQRLPEAIASFELALALQPDNASFHWSKAHAALMNGDFRIGWHHYERRWQREGGEAPRQYAVPQWTGRKDLRGKTLLIHGEQGVGDIIQFCRYALDVIALGGKVVFGMPPILHSLLRSMHPSIKTIVADAEHPDFDFHCPVMSLPHAFSTTLETIPAPCPYFFVDDQVKQVWQERLGQRTRPRVGLAWFGNPKHVHDHRRSIPLESLRTILQLPIEFHSLQVEHRAQDALVLQDFPHIAFHGDQLGDYAQTAALIESLDLVICVDTSVAHLAGALGKPVWVLIHAVPDFRWLLGRQDSPWYPSVRLFRQARRDSWAEALDAVRATLIQNFDLPTA